MRVAPFFLFGRLQWGRLSNPRLHCARAAGLPGGGVQERGRVRCIVSRRERGRPGGAFYGRPRGHGRGSRLGREGWACLPPPAFGRPGPHFLPAPPSGRPRRRVQGGPGKPADERSASRHACLGSAGRPGRFLYGACTYVRRWCASLKTARAAPGRCLDVYRVAGGDHGLRLRGGGGGSGAGGAGGAGGAAVAWLKERVGGGIGLPPQPPPPQKRRRKQRRTHQ